MSHTALTVISVDAPERNVVTLISLGFTRKAKTAVIGGDLSGVDY